MKTKGKFILLSIEEFATYINNLNISRYRKITHIQTHHTWSPSYRNFNGNNHFEKMESMETEHKKRGFKEIGQHFTTFPDGLIGTGRNLNIIPACIEGHNTGGICIENLGNFNLGGDRMNAAHSDTILKLNALLCIKFKLPVNTDTIVYHHWFRLGSGIRDNGRNDVALRFHKTCPGTGFFGGNKVEDASNNFLPLIQIEYNKYQNISTPNIISSILRTGTVNADVLNVRTGPGTDFSKSGQLKNAEKITVYESNTEWARIGIDQWVSLKFLDTIPYNLSEAGLPKAMVNVELLNVRQGPGTEFAKTGLLRSGAIVHIIESKNLWDRIDDTQWVYSSYLDKSSAVSDTLVFPSGIVNADLLNVRKGPGTNFSIIKQVKRATAVTIYQSKGEWDSIGENEWVFSDYIALN